MTAITLVTLTGCAFLTEDEWEDGAGSVVEMSITASTEMIPEFILDDQATYAILEPKSASIKEQKILYTLKKAFSSSNRTLIDDIKKAKYVLAYSETLQRSTRVYSVPTFYSTYTNYTGFSGQSVNVTSMTTGSKTQIETNYYNVINLSLFEWKGGLLSIVWSGDTVVDSTLFKTQYPVYTELLFRLFGKETQTDKIDLLVMKDKWEIVTY